MDIKVGWGFDTEYEYDCVITSEPDESGNFTAFDSDGVECQYSMAMVRNLREWS